MQEIFTNLTRRTTLLLASGLVLIVYGYLCRALGLYFFWESKSIGWAVLFIGIVSLLVDRIIAKNRENKKALPEKIITGLVCFILLIQTILLVAIPLSDAFSVSKSYLQNSNEIKNEVGAVSGFSLMPLGGIQKSIDSEGESGSATINLTVKGEKKFKDVVVYVVKNPNASEWEVEGIE